MTDPRVGNSRSIRKITCWALITDKDGLIFNSSSRRLKVFLYLTRRRVGVLLYRYNRCWRDECQFIGLRYCITSGSISISARRWWQRIFRAGGKKKSESLSPITKYPIEARYELWFVRAPAKASKTRTNKCWKEEQNRHYVALTYKVCQTRGPQA